MYIKLDLHINPAPRHVPQVPSCFDDIISTIASYWNINCLPMFAGSYSFLLRESSGKYYERVYTEDPGRDILTKYCGITYKFVEKCRNSTLEEVVISELSENRPIVVHFDAYYCPWDQFKGKIHNNHMVTVSGIDTDNSKIHICDSWFDIEEWVDISLLDDACKFYVLFSRSNNDIKEMDKELAFKILWSSIYSGGTSAFDSIRKFANDIKSNFDHNDIECDNFFYSAYHNVFQSVIYSRCKYLSFLLYASEKFGILSKEKCMEFKRFALAWRNIQWMIGKAYVQKADKNSALIGRICEKITLLADEEEYFLFENILNKKDAVQEDLNFHGMIIDREKADMIDLSRYYNNKAFDYLSIKYGANFGGAEEFFALDGKDISESVIYKGIDLCLFDNVQNEYDNVVCLSQRIEIPKRKYQKAVVCGFCEYGTYTDFFSITDTSKNTKYFEISFSDYPAPPREGERSVFDSDVYYTVDGKLEIAHKNCHIFAREIELNLNTDADSITLPYCPCMHIFSMFLM